MKTKISFIFLILFMSLPAWAFRDSLTALHDPYTKVVKEYTREGAVYSWTNLDADFIWDATYTSEEFRQAFKTQFDKLYPNGQDGLADKLGHPWDGQNNIEFFISLYARQRGLKKLTGAKNLWDLSLEVNSKTYKPIMVEEVVITPFEQKFYPFLTPWSQAFRVIFPVEMVDISKTPLTLQLASVAGKSKLRFK